MMQPKPRFARTRVKIASGVSSDDVMSRSVDAIFGVGGGEKGGLHGILESADGGGEGDEGGDVGVVGAEGGLDGEVAADAAGVVAETVWTGVGRDGGGRRRKIIA